MMYIVFLNIFIMPHLKYKREYIFRVESIHVGNE